MADGSEAESDETPLAATRPYLQPRN